MPECAAAHLSSETRSAAGSACLDDAGHVRRHARTGGHAAQGGSGAHPLLPGEVRRANFVGYFAGLFWSWTDSSISVATPRGSSVIATCVPGNVRMVQPRATARCQLLSVLARSS